MKLKPWLFALIEQHLAEDVREAARDEIARMISRRDILIDICVIAIAGAASIPTAQAASEVRPHRHMRSRHRRWGCWWERGTRWWHWGHRVCGWR